MSSEWEIEELRHKYNKALEYLFALSREVKSFRDCHGPTGHRIRHDNAEGLATRVFKTFGDEAQRLGFLETDVPF